MESYTPTFGEWEAAPLRPVARWVREIDHRGRSRPVMVWRLPEVDPALIEATARSTA